MCYLSNRQMLQKSVQQLVKQWLLVMAPSSPSVSGQICSQPRFHLFYLCSTLKYLKVLKIKNILKIFWVVNIRGILVKLVICVVPGHWKIKILNLKKRNKFICFFMFLYPIQGGKNIGSPYLTNKSWFFGKSDVPGQQNKSYIGVMASKNLIFLMFWLSFVYL